MPKKIKKRIKKDKSKIVVANKTAWVPPKSGVISENNCITTNTFNLYLHGIKKIYCFNQELLVDALNQMSDEKAERLSEHTSRYGNHLIKLYPQNSFDFLFYAENLNLFVEHPIGVGVKNKKEVLVVEDLQGPDFKEIILDSDISLLKAMKSLGRTTYEFSRLGITPGDSKLQNYVYANQNAYRIDLVPHRNSKVEMDWDYFNKNKEDAWKRYRRAMELIMEDIECIFLDLAKHLVIRAGYAQRFEYCLDSFFRGFNNDDLSGGLEIIFKAQKQFEILDYMQKSVLTGINPVKLHYRRIKEHTNGTLTLDIYDH